jgi:hypothetical protein
VAILKDLDVFSSRPIAEIPIYGLTKTLFARVSRTSPPCATFEQSNSLCGGYGLVMTPEPLWGSLSPTGYLPLGAGYFFEASSGVIGVATGRPPVPWDPGDGAAPAWFAPEGGLAYSPPPPDLVWPAAGLEKIRTSQLTATTETTVTNFVFIFMIKLS